MNLTESQEEHLFCYEQITQSGRLHLFSRGLFPCPCLLPFHGGQEQANKRIFIKKKTAIFFSCRHRSSGIWLVSTVLQLGSINISDFKDSDFNVVFLATCYCFPLFWEQKLTFQCEVYI